MSIGILLGEMPRMLHDVVGDIVGVEPDLHVIADGVQAGALVDRVERDHPDVVVLWAQSATPPALCDELLGRFPQLAVVALEDGGQRASIYVMRPARLPLSEMSRTQLVTAIRRAAVGGGISGGGPLHGHGHSGHDRIVGEITRLSPDTGIEPVREPRSGGDQS